MSESDAGRRQAKLEHLAQVRALSESVGSAISALETNDLSRLERDIALQESICGRMRPETWLLPTSSGSPTPSDPGDDLVAEMHRAHTALSQLNRVYASLLGRSQRSKGLMAALYQSYENGYGKQPAVGEENRSWSCEV